MVETPVEAMSLASDLPSRRAGAPICSMASQFLCSALLACSRTLEWARNGTGQCGINASKHGPSRMYSSAAALVTGSCRSKMGWVLSGDSLEHGNSSLWTWCSAPPGPWPWLVEVQILPGPRAFGSGVYYLFSTRGSSQLVPTFTLEPHAALALPMCTF